MFRCAGRSAVVSRASTRYTILMTTITPEALVCPQCYADLVEVERAGVMVDACPRCRGMWLDRGELDRIVAREGHEAFDEIDTQFVAAMRRRLLGLDAPDGRDASRDMLGPD